MPRTSNKKFLDDGTPNPKYRPGTPNKKFLDDGTPNPKYRPNTKLLEDGTPNPKYRPGNANTKLLEDGTPNPKYRPGTPTRSDFLAWDSEGLDRVEGDAFSHAATLLMNSTGAYVENDAGLSTMEWLRFFCDEAEKNPRAIHVMFSFGYDINMLLRDIPRGGYTTDEHGKRIPAYPGYSLESIQAGEAIRYGCYELQYRQHKSFTIRRYDPNDKYEPVFKYDPTTKKREPVMVRDASGKLYQKLAIKWSVSLVIYDTFGFFQASFVKALESYMGKQYEGLAFIADMKNRRSAFTHEDKDQIREYCKQECVMLVDLLENLRACLVGAGLHLTRWDGAGACAAALMKREGIKDHKEDFDQKIVSAAQYAYAGGRIETLQYGHIAVEYDAHGTALPKVWHYDIRSAYPAAMLYLPSLVGGKWAHYARRRSLNTAFVRSHTLFSLYRIEWDYQEERPLYPFFFRSEIGSILFPQNGAGWVWGPELLAALDCMPEQDVTIHEAYVFQPASDEKPFSFLPPLFEQRAKWKKEGNGAEKALKLAINSLYGKMAQKQGYIPRGSTELQAPPYHQLEWAGFVTSFTRSVLYRAAMRNPTAIISIATDGIFSTEDLALEESSTLGGWELEIHPGMTQVTSGVYWLDCYDMDKVGGYKRDEQGRVIVSEKMYCRGFDKESVEREQEMLRKGKEYYPISRKRVLSTWDTLVTHENGSTNYGRVLKCSARRFVTLGSSLAGDEQFKYWHTWKDMIRILQLNANGTKREDIPATGKGAKIDSLYGKVPPSRRMVRTRPAKNFYYNLWVEADDGRGRVRRQPISLKHPLPWSRDDSIVEEMLDGASAHIVEQEIEDSYH